MIHYYDFIDNYLCVVFPLNEYDTKEIYYVDSNRIRYIVCILLQF